MDNKTISFSTGNLIINDNNISFQLNFGSAHEVNTIGRENIGHTEIQDMRVLPKVDIVYCFRMAAISAILFIAGIFVVFFTKSFLLVYLSGFFMLFALLIYFGVIWLDGIFGLNIAKPILISIFGVDAVRVVVQNIYGGNNLHFFVLRDEKRKIPKFENYKLEKIHKVENIRNIDSTANNIDDIEKLANLRDKGIISQEEFDLKKRKILGI